MEAMKKAITTNEMLDASYKNGYNAPIILFEATK